MAFKTTGTFTKPDNTTLLDVYALHFDRDRNKVSIRSTWSDIEIGINADALIEFINRNKPDIFEPF